MVGLCDYNTHPGGYALEISPKLRPALIVARYLSSGNRPRFALLPLL